MKAARYDVVIAGAGISGLSLGALLARDGYSVLLVERNENFGGRFAPARRDGFTLDFGIHACLLGKRGAVARVVRKSQLDVRIKPVGVCLYRDGRLASFIGENPLSIVFQRALKPTSLLTLGREALLRRGKASYRTPVKGSKKESETDVLLEYLSVSLLPTSEFELASRGEILAFTRQAIRRAATMGYPSGGWVSVIDGLIDSIRKNSRCEVLSRTALEQVLLEGGRVRKVIAGGEEVDTRACVLAFPPQEISNVKFRPQLEEKYVGFLESLEPAFGLIIDLGLRKPLTRESRVIISIEPPALLWAVSNVEPSLAPPGKQYLQIFTPLRRGEAGNNDLIVERTEGLASFAERVFSSNLDEEWRRVMPTVVTSVAHYTWQSMRERPSIRVPGAPGAFMIGDGVNCHGLGGDLAARSALFCAKILEKWLSKEAL